MLLAQRTEYAFRIAAFLALKYGEGYFRASEVAESTHIPVHYSAKILRMMVRAGLLDAQKGHGGGFALARPPHTIRFLQVLEATEGVQEGRRCVFGLDECSDRHPCALHARWKEISEAFDRWARDTTLADVRQDANEIAGFKISRGK